MEHPYLIAGLGNPGREYQQTRHNAGFLAVERLASRWRVGWTEESRFEARLAKADWQGKKIWLCEPLTYMNNSGEAVAAVARFYRIPVQQLLVAVDDADLPFGTIRLRPEGSPGGHHGLESIEQHLGTPKYARQRIGIGRQSQTVREITGHVLGTFAAGERTQLEKVLERSADQMECWLAEGCGKAMNQFNGAVNGTDEKESK